MSRAKMMAVVLLVASAGVVVGCVWPFRAAGKVLRLHGTVESQEIHLGSKVGGRVAKVMVREGDFVEPGQELVRFEAPELEAQRDQWQARVRFAEAALTKARNGPRAEEKQAAEAILDASKAKLQRLKTGWREEEIRQALAESQAAVADLKLAREDAERAIRLWANKSVARSDYDAALAARDRAQSRAAAAAARLEMLQSGSRVEDIAEAEAEVRRADANYRLLLAGTRAEDIAQAEALLAEARAKLLEIEAQLREAVVVAPAKAVVEVVAVRVGDLAPAHHPVVRILHADDLWVKAYVPETELGRVRLGDEVDIQIDSYPERRFRGKVIQIASMSEFTPRNVQTAEGRRHQVFGVKIRVDEDQGVFKAGLAAEVLLPLHD